MSKPMKPPVEIDEYTRRGHEAFKAAARFKVHYGKGEAKTLTWVEWEDWQAHRDPIADDPVEAEKVRKELEKARKGPGMARRR